MLTLRHLIPGYIQNDFAEISRESCFKINFLLKYNVQTEWYTNLMCTVHKVNRHNQAAVSKVKF